MNKDESRFMSPAILILLSDLPFVLIESLSMVDSSDGSADDSHPADPGSNLGAGSYDNLIVRVTRIDGYVVHDK